MDSIAILHLWGIALSFLGSCFFSGTETALTSLTAVQAEKLAKSRSWFAKSLDHWIRHPNRLLATNLLGNTLVNTAIATLATSFVVTFYPVIGVAWVTTILTISILIFGEIFPKMVARTYNEQIAPYSCRVLVLLNYIFYPITHVITQGIVLSLKTFGFVLSTNRLVSTSDIEQMVALATRQGSVEKDKSKILYSIFQFSKRRVKDIMIQRDQISAIHVDASLLEVLDTVRTENHSRYPVYKGSLDRIIGFLHARDLFGILRAYASVSDRKSPVLTDFSLRTCLRRAFFVSDQSMISRVLNEMKSQRIHLAIVKDEWGNVVGLVTLEDILEEVFGEIEDEHDERTFSPVVDLYESGVEVEGSEPLVDLKSKYGVEIEPSESYSTVNGLIQHYASHQQLSTKTVIIWKNYVFTILKAKDGEVEKVRITQLPEDEKDKE